MTKWDGDFNRVEFMFAYGMNTNLTSMLLRCRNAKVIGATVLPNHRLDFRYHLDVTPDANSYVEGVLWQIDLEDLSLIDRVEGYPEYYTRHLLTPFRKYLGNTFNAWTYTMRDKSNLEYPDDQYLDLVLQGYQENGIDFQQIDDALQRVEQYKLKENVNGY